ncbi:hypothetical protein CPB84DRAFT_1785218 [Gymnopilus junonius]|uniref:Uncharacterized protein n=1 Tax=Gymnopilus junonius TaxID=109634 RepID=A0A9P5TL85_GYMJU|nr:hypothetical protein CPB84DRAFT_1785218 [Gymnopilus junonius]
MNTSLPDLPFVSHGNAMLGTSCTHSAAKVTPEAHPRTDLDTFLPWTSFADEIHNSVQVAM